MVKGTSKIGNMGHGRGGGGEDNRFRGNKFRFQLYMLEMPVTFTEKSSAQWDSSQQLQWRGSCYGE